MTNTNVAPAQSLSAAVIPHQEPLSPTPSFRDTSSMAAVEYDLNCVQDTPDPEQDIPVDVPPTNKRATRGKLQANAPAQNSGTRKTRSSAMVRPQVA